MEESAKVLIASLVNVINDLNRPSLSRNYRQIRPDITTSNVISLKSSGFSGPTIFIQNEKGKRGFSTRPAESLDSPSSEAATATKPEVSGPVDYSDINDYFTSDPSPLLESPETEVKPIEEISEVGESKRIESFQYGDLDERVLYLDPDNPSVLSPRGKMEIWRELNTLKS